MQTPSAVQQVSDWSPDELVLASFGVVCHSSVLTQHTGSAFTNSRERLY